MWLQCKHSAKFYEVFCKGFGGTKHIYAAQDISRCDPRLLSYLKGSSPNFIYNPPSLRWGLQLLGWATGLTFHLEIKSVKVGEVGLVCLQHVISREILVSCGNVCIVVWNWGRWARKSRMTRHDHGLLVRGDPTFTIAYITVSEIWMYEQWKEPAVVTHLWLSAPTCSHPLGHIQL